MPLDEITCRLFPTLARYARRTHRLLLLCTHTLLFLAGVAVTFMFLGYHQHVATENQSRLLVRVADLEDQYGRHHNMRTTAAQAQVIVTQKERERTP